MLWKMSGWAESANSACNETKMINVETYVNAESMDEAFHIAKTIYGNGIDKAQVVNNLIKED